MFKTILQSLISLVLILAPAFAQEKKDPPRVRADSIIAPRKGDISKVIHIIIDKSGSMTEEQLQIALSEALTIASQGMEDLHVAVTLFGQSWLRMAHNNPDSPIGKNWVQLPSKPGLKAIQKFLGMAIDGRDTLLYMPLRLAIQEKQIEKHDLTIIVISDFKLSNMDKLREQIPLLMRNRKVQLGFVGIEANRERTKLLAKACKAWFVNLHRVYEDEDDE